MSEVTLPIGWKHSSLIRLAEYHNGAAFNPKHWGEDGLPIIRIEQINDPNAPTDFYNGPLIPQNRIGNGDLIFSWSATLKAVLWKHGEGALNQHLFKVVPRPGTNKDFLFQVLDYHMERIASGSHGSTMKHITRRELQRYHVELPDSEDQQRRIAEILSTVDEAMEQTEALVGKLEQMKAGLMHDLFTRGVTPDGHLRPTRQEAPHLYHETPLGWLPKEWRYDTIGSITDSVVDGPFGSNLKTEHYVVEPGVRVVRLQNVDEGQYNDEERAFVSESHANFLMRNQVLPGDVLIAGLGEDNNVVGRACCYPDGLPPAINKADCFRLRCLPAQALNAFVMFFLNTAAARRQVRRFEQGVTRRRINTGNMKKIFVSLPSIAEQQPIVQRLADAGAQIEISTTHLAKLRQQKQGLMQDLLTGRVPV
jgi:type I restriction enzyme S subunit